jgi:hypothetical protein
MPIFENSALIECERKIYDLLSTINEAEQHLSLRIPVTSTFIHKKILTTENDIACESICLFYLDLIQLVNQSLQIKHSFSEQNTKFLPKMNQELDKIKIRISGYTETLRTTKPEHWNFLLSRQIGRLSLYYLINISFINNLWGNSLFIQMWVIELMRTTESAEEQQLLEHLKVLAIQIYNTSTVTVIEDEVLKSNQYIFLQYELNVIDTKEKFFALLSIPILFSKELPLFTINFIKINLAYKIFQTMFNLKLTPEEMLALFKTTAIQSFFAGNILHKIETPQDILQLIYVAYNHFRIYTRLYSISLDRGLMLQERGPDLIYILLTLYKTIQEKNSVQPDTIYMLSTCCSLLISTGQYAIWNNYGSHEKNFWEIAGLVFGFNGLVKLEFIEILNIQINSLLDNLVLFGFMRHATKILSSFIELNEGNPILNKTNKKYYLALLSIFKFCNLFPLESSAADQQVFLNEFLTAASHQVIDEFNHIPLSVLKKTWPKLPSSILDFTIEKLKILQPLLNFKKLSSRDLDNLHKLQGLCHQLFRVTDASKEQFSLLGVYLKERELSEIRMQELFADEKTAKTKIKKPSAKVITAAPPAAKDKEKPAAKAPTPATSPAAKDKEKPTAKATPATTSAAQDKEKPAAKAPTSATSPAAKDKEKPAAKATPATSPAAEDKEKPAAKATPATSPAAEDKDKPAAKAPTPIVMHSLFSACKAPQEHIAIKEIPSCLLDLAKKIKQKFNTNMILCGGAVTHLFLKRPNPNDFDCLVFNVDLSELYRFLTASGYSHCYIVGRHYPILKIQIKEEDKNYDIDLTTENAPDPENVDKCMAEILSKRDFKLSALYLDLIPSQPHFEIKGFDGAIDSLKQKKISIVHNPKRSTEENTFTEDPLRLFRLIKLSFQYPDFSFDRGLEQTLGTTSLQTIFEKFLKVDLNQSRIGTALELLFKRFDLLEVIHRLGTSGILEGITGLSFDKIQHHLSHFHKYASSKIQQLLSLSDFTGPVGFQESQGDLIAYTKKLAFFQFLSMCYFIENPDKALFSWIAYGLIRKVKISDQNFILIHQAISLNRPEILFEPGLIKLFQEIKSEFEISKATSVFQAPK